MSNNALLTTGIVGSVIAALCCATPVLAVLLGALGLSAWIGGIDYVVLPALAVFLILVVYAHPQPSKTSRDTGWGHEGLT